MSIATYREIESIAIPNDINPYMSHFSDISEPQNTWMCDFTAYTGQGRSLLSPSYWSLSKYIIEIEVTFSDSRLNDVFRLNRSLREGIKLVSFLVREFEHIGCHVQIKAYKVSLSQWLFGSPDPSLLEGITYSTSSHK